MKQAPIILIEHLEMILRFELTDDQTKKILAQLLEIDRSDRESLPILSRLIIENELDVLRNILNKKFNFDCFDYGGESPIFISLSHDTRGALNMLLEHEEAIVAVNEKGVSPIMLAAEQGLLYAVKKCIERVLIFMAVMIRAIRSYITLQREGVVK